MCSVHHQSDRTPARAHTRTFSLIHTDTSDTALCYPRAHFGARAESLVIFFVFSLCMSLTLSFLYYKDSQPAEFCFCFNVHATACSRCVNVVLLSPVQVKMDEACGRKRDYF
uniref:Uncharacterized protein n=1 Tax=Chrysotila carterae TaxID=13221 RepID=A0A7S4FC82_CHRCT